VPRRARPRHLAVVAASLQLGVIRRPIPDTRAELGKTKAAGSIVLERHAKQLSRQQPQHTNLSADCPDSMQKRRGQSNADAKQGLPPVRTTMPDARPGEQDLGA
jgi:hypothetical protein